MQIEDILDKLLEDPEFRADYERKDATDLALRIALEIEHARIAKEITQQELAEKMGTQQPSIARAERGVSLPSLSFLHKMAEALDTYVIEPQFAFLHEKGGPRISAIDDKGASLTITLPREAATSGRIPVPSAWKNITADTPAQTFA